MCKLSQGLTGVRLSQATLLVAGRSTLSCYLITLEAWTCINCSPPFDPSLSTPRNTNEPYLDWVNWLLNQHSIPQVISTSYGDDEQTVPKSCAERVCRQFAAVSARGTSLLFSSGDKGVGSFDGSECLSNDGKNATKFLPSFPASVSLLQQLMTWIIDVGPE